MSNRLQAGFSIYGEHSHSRDMLMSSYSFPTPKMKEIKETVPYMSGSYDFSFYMENQLTKIVKYRSK